MIALPRSGPKIRLAVCPAGNGHEAIRTLSLRHGQVVQMSLVASNPRIQSATSRNDVDLLTVAL